MTFQQPKFENRTKTEDKKLTELNRLIKISDIKCIKFRSMIDAYNKKIEEEKKDRFKLSLKIRDIENKMISRCNHNKYPRTYWSNCRDDRSFERYCGCWNCGEIIWDECK